MLIVGVGSCRRSSSGGHHQPEIQVNKKGPDEQLQVQVQPSKREAEKQRIAEQRRKENTFFNGAWRDR